MISYAPSVLEIEAGLSSNTTFATSVSATFCPFVPVKIISFMLSTVSYSPSGYSTVTVMSSPSILSVVASIPLNIWLSVVPILEAVSPYAFAMTGSIFRVMIGALFSILEWMLMTSVLAVISLTILSLTSFNSSYCVP